MASDRAFGVARHRRSFPVRLSSVRVLPAPIEVVFVSRP
jgi:hypothetical protein